MKSISCLVISKSYKLINNMLASLNEAKKEWSTLDEVLCSWNGTDDDEGRIIQGQKLNFRIGQKAPYHFAKNMNELAKMATGDYILLINDDVVLDKGSIDTSIEVIERNKDIGIVGGLLRGSDNTLSHAGVLFNCELMPYNRCRPEFGSRIDLDSVEVKRSGPITAVTGALILMNKEDLLKVPMRETFLNCCEDIALCLDVLKKTNKVTYFSSEMTGIHNEKSTRGLTDDIYDFEKLKNIIKSYKIELPQMWILNMWWQANEGEWLKNMYYKELMINHKNEVLLLEKEKLIQMQSSKMNRVVGELDKTIKSWNLDRKLLIEGQKSLEKRINDIQTSRSWKLTRPIRAMVNRIKQQGRK